ncbi:glycosyltransferase family 2 protein [Psychroserpens burtonensis]|uniref:Glycosyltransferase family 2 protein n=1 Tax=Psychroserpens burtonensis TaxID=49278 RepID=A0A5C7BFI4_9FLAO|nr:glycosyltransferase family 2 protein [Psychroserpens burtonensis]TXE17259.1 glycosyltransferase family 2 protein [Psychroserpens burtonensis]
MQKPLISILTPFKNTALYLTDCIDSLINQSYTNWELLIVDDHSTDHSYDVVLAFAEIDKRIKLLNNSGQGIIEALRLAYSKSNGAYITRMDSDDIMHPDKLGIMLHDLQTHGKQHVSLGLVSYFCDGGIGDGYARYESWLNGLTQKGKNYSEIYKECVIPSPCWMMHRDDFNLCGAFSPNRYPEDYDLAFRFYKNKMSCIPSSSVLHHWRDYNTRASRTDEHYAENHFLELKVDYFLELNYDASRPLTIWGAGQKGKKVAQLLQKKQIPFIWICNNPKKIGKHIYDELLYNFEHLKVLKNPQSVVNVANTEAQLEIKAYFNTQKMLSMVDYFFFC